MALRDERLQKLLDAHAEICIKCKCGRKEAIPVYAPKRICTWCGRAIYRDKKLEFKEKLLKARKEIKNNET